MTAAAYALYCFPVLVLAVVAGTTLSWNLFAWRSADHLDATRFADEAMPPAHSFSLIVPARHEARVLPITLARLLAMDHPDFEVLVVVGDDDPETRAVAEECAAASGGLMRVLVDDSASKSKPRALNTALPHCRGDVIGVFDAEDDAAAGLLAAVDRSLQASGADVVQGGTQLMNYRSSWYALRNVLEYYFWFRSRLHYHAHRGFVPLGGNTVFVRADVLRAVGGWDGDCLAEDCDLGARLSARGARTVVVYDPALATREETPASLGALVRQRTRWNQGYLQVLRKGHWRRLSRRQRLLAGYTLALPLAQALAGVLVPISIATMIWVRAPVPLTMLSFAPLLVSLAILAVEAAALSEFCRAYGVPIGLRDHVRLVVGSVPYQWLLGYAALRAVVREVRGVRNWEKTHHAGAHLGLRV